MKMNHNLFFATSYLISSILFIDNAYGAKISDTSPNAYIKYERTDRKPFCRDKNNNEILLSKCQIKKGFYKFNGGRIYTDRNSSAKIFCNSGEEKDIPPNSNGVPLVQFCDQEPSSALGDGVEIRRGKMNDSNVPYIVGPRYSLILDKEPIFRWNSLSDTTFYTVELFHDRDKFTPVCKNEKVLPELIQSGIASASFHDICGSYQLREKYFYSLVVTANNGGKSSKEESINLNDYRTEDRGVSGTGFRLINSERLQEPTKALLESIANDSTSSESKIYRSSLVYTQNQLYAEAILKLEKVVDSGSSDIDIYLELGDLYAESGLLFQAKQTYSRALQIVEKISDENNLKILYRQDLDSRLNALKID
jgi:tetratricopeptide (TPR) repeat protein